MQLSTCRIAAMGAAGLALLAGPAVAGGFQLNERSTKALGASLAGSVSAASDASFAGFNPAALSRLPGSQIAGNISAVLPSSEGTFATGPARGFSFDSGQGAAVPAFAIGGRINEFTSVGLVSHSPFGLVTDHPANFPGAADGRSSDLRTVQISPTVAFDITPTLSLGVAADILYADVVLKSAIANLDGDTTEVGFSLGLHWQPAAGTRVGLAYHSGFDLETDGTQRNFLLGGATAPLSAEASLPGMLQVGLTQDVTERLTVMGEARFINWSEFSTISFESPGFTGTPFASFEEVQNYEDAFFGALGAEYAATPALTIRGGVAYDDTPTTDAFRTVRVPDGDRVWLSAGASYEVSDAISVDLAYNYLHVVSDPEVTLRNGPVAGSRIEYDGRVHIVSLGGALRF